MFWKSENPLTHEQAKMCNAKMNPRVLCRLGLAGRVADLLFRTHCEQNERKRAPILLDNAMLQTQSMAWPCKELVAGTRGRAGSGCSVHSCFLQRRGSTKRCSRYANVSDYQTTYHLISFYIIKRRLLTYSCSLIRQSRHL